MKRIEMIKEAADCNNINFLALMLIEFKYDCNYSVIEYLNGEEYNDLIEYSIRAYEIAIKNFKDDFSRREKNV